MSNNVNIRYLSALKTSECVQKLNTFIYIYIYPSKNESIIIMFYACENNKTFEG